MENHKSISLFKIFLTPEFWKWGGDVVILQCESPAGFAVERFGCLQPLEKMLKLRRMRSLAGLLSRRRLFGFTSLPTAAVRLSHGLFFLCTTLKEKIRYELSFYIGIGVGRAS